MSYQDVLKLPVRAFWSLNTQIGRLRSEEILDQIDLALLSNMNADASMIKELRASHLERMGEPMLFKKQIIMPTREEHSEGIAKLKQFAGR